MITVRFPSGFSVQYNDLDRMKWSNGEPGRILLYRGEEEGWKVSVPSGCDCRIRAALSDLPSRARSESKYRSPH